MIHPQHLVVVVRVLPRRRYAKETRVGMERVVGLLPSALPNVQMCLPPACLHSLVPISGAPSRRLLLDWDRESRELSLSIERMASKDVNGGVSTP
jgi:hypothetical protein